MFRFFLFFMLLVRLFFLRLILVVVSHMSQAFKSIRTLLTLRLLSAHCCCVLDACLPVIKLSFLLRVFVCTDLFSLFASDLGGYAAREDIEAVLQVLDGEVPASLKESFGEVSKRCKRLHSINLLTHALMQVSCRLMTPRLLSQSAWSLQRFQSHAYKRAIVTGSLLAVIIQSLAYQRVIVLVIKIPPESMQTSPLPPPL